MNAGITEGCCSPKPSLRERSLISGKQASDLEDLFKVLANDTRLRLLHALARADEMCVTELAEAVGMKPQAVSNQLQRLADMAIVTTERNGTYIRYRIVDPCITALLDHGLCLLEDSQTRKTSNHRR